MSALVAGILLGFIVIGSPAHEDLPHAAMERAKTLLHQGETEQGRTLLERTIKNSPLYFPAYIELGRSLLAEDSGRARLFAAEVLRIDPDNEDALNLLSSSYERARAVGLSLEQETKLRALEISDYDAVLQQRPKHADVLYRSASQRLALERLLPPAQLEPRKKMLDAAVIELARLRQILKEAGDSTLRAAAHFQSGRAKKHRGDFERSISQDAEHYYRDSIEHFQDALALEPERIDALGEILLILATTGDRSAARVAVETHLAKLKPDWARAKVLSMLGNLEVEDGDIENGEAHIDQALKLNPRLMDAYVGLYRSNLAKGDAAQGVATMQRAVSAEPNFLLGHLLIGQHHADEQRYEEAIESFERILQVAPQRAAVLGMLPSKNLYRNGLYYDAASRLAWLYMRVRNDKSGALKMAERAQTYAPLEPYLMDTIGWIYFELGKFQDAEQTLKLAIGQNDKIASAHYHLAETQNALGNTSDARASLRRAFAIGEQFSQIEQAQALREALEAP